MSNTNAARGMRDFLPADIRKRNYVINIIKQVYESYGFEPLETPSVENLETLTGKYGEEGNQLMFKILKRGEKLQEELAEGKITNENELTDLALRYDLTVPLARVVANYKNDLPKFFKRYQIQPVWRADRPARGRYREFYQCDVDAIGSSSMIVEAELCAAVCEILERLGFYDFIIWINNRKLLSGVLESANVLADKNSDVLVSLDKLDKIGEDGVEAELIGKGVSEESIAALLSFIRKVKQTHGMFDGIKASKGDEFSDQQLNKAFNDTTLQMMRVDVLENIGIGIKGIDDLEEIFQLLYNIGISTVRVNPSLARGLSYYTGAIFEVVLTNGDFAGSIAGGGRYDGLIGMFGKEQIPAVGFSIGLERILFVMEERGMFPDDLTTNSADVMVTLWNEETAGESLKLANELRGQNLRVLVYPEADKLGKQFKYADSLNIPFICILGENELAENKVALKNLKTGEQETVARKDIAAKIL